MTGAAAELVLGVDLLEVVSETPELVRSDDLVRLGLIAAKDGCLLDKLDGDGERVDAVDVRAWADEGDEFAHVVPVGHDIDGLEVE
jgi:hypothetical protein